FMIILGGIIGGVSNMIVIKMLFDGFKRYYIFRFGIGLRVGLIAKGGEEIARKIGEVIEEDVISEEVIGQKLNERQWRK
ncbi:DUF445 family protein, partial [Staphylococcus epidermidis]|uniref:DUF445 family protein n=1 Tax=Staphylococcus epidermidis TaxID=1282 RepID=UPI0011A6B22D